MTTSLVHDDGGTAESERADEDEAHQEEEVSNHQQLHDREDGGTGEVAAAVAAVVDNRHVIHSSVPGTANEAESPSSHDGGFSMPRSVNNTFPSVTAGDSSIAFSAVIVDADEEDRMVNELVQRALHEERERITLAEVIPDEDDADSSVMGDTPEEPRVPPSGTCWRQYDPRFEWLLVLLVALGAAAAIIWVNLNKSPDSPPYRATARIVIKQWFQIDPVIKDQRVFNVTEQVWFCSTLEGYTEAFNDAPVGNKGVETSCRIISQRLQIIGRNRELLQEGRVSRSENSTDRHRRAQRVVYNQVEYSMTYSSSSTTNVRRYPFLFEGRVNDDLGRLTTDLQNAGLSVVNSFPAYRHDAAR